MLGKYSEHLAVENFENFESFFSRRRMQIVAIMHGIPSPPYSKLMVCGNGGGDREVGVWRAPEIESSPPDDSGWDARFLANDCSPLVLYIQGGAITLPTLKISVVCNRMKKYYYKIAYWNRLKTGYHIAIKKIGMPVKSPCFHPHKNVVFLWLNWLSFAVYGSSRSSSSTSVSELDTIAVFVIVWYFRLCSDYELTRIIWINV